MPTIRVQTTEKVVRSFAPPGRRALREEEMRRYRDAVAQLSADRPGNIVEQDEEETPRQAMQRLHRAAREKGLAVRFYRGSQSGSELWFRLQTPAETTRLTERRARLAEARQARRQPEPEPPKRTSRQRAS